MKMEEREKERITTNKKLFFCLFLFLSSITDCSFASGMLKISTIKHSIKTKERNKYVNIGSIKHRNCYVQ